MANAESPKHASPEINWNWQATTYNPAWHEATFSVMERYVPASSRILEIGAGGSHTLGALAGRLQCNAYGLEPDTDGIAKARELAVLESATIQMIEGDGFCLPFQNGGFDVVYSLGLIEHFSPEETLRLVKEHVRVCKPGGLVIISVPNFWNLPHTIRKGLQGRKYDYYPERSYSSNRLCEVLRESGLEIIAVDGMNPHWGIVMMAGGWRLIVVLQRLRVLQFLTSLKNPRWRAMVGYMTYAVATKR